MKIKCPVCGTDKVKITGKFGQCLLKKCGMPFGFKRVRKGFGFLVQETGLSFALLSKMAKGERTMTKTSAELLSPYLGYNVEQLMDYPTVMEEFKQHNFEEFVENQLK